MMIAITGYAGSAKSTLAAAIRDSASQAGVAVIESLGRTIYQIHDVAAAALEEAGIVGMPEKDRVLLQLLGDDWGRNTLGVDVWVDALIRRVNANYTARELVIVDDLRMASDAEALRNVYGPKVYVVKISRENNPGATDGIINHTSERDISNIEADVEVRLADTASIEAAMVEVYEKISHEFRRRVSNGFIKLPDLTEAEVEAALVENLTNG